MEVTILNVLDVIGTWIAAIGTVGAVITSLWLSYNSSKAKLKIKVTSRDIISEHNTIEDIVCFIEIFNVGYRTVTISSLGWSITRGKEKKTFIQNTKGSSVDKLPITLKEGEEANIVLSFYKNDWLHNMARNITGFKTDDLYVLVSTSQDIFKAKINKSLVDDINKERKKIANDAN
ncbi:MAG: hypothetical protein AB7D96_11085 [Arcobacteraceae bacterium]